MNRVAIIDFETTGLRAGDDRIIEVGAAIIRDGEIEGTFSELIDPGFAIPGFITGYTGISDAMVRGKPRAEAVMPRLRDFLGDTICVAHNASFDQRFYAAEMSQARLSPIRTFLCSMMLSRRLVQQAPNHRLGTLVDHLKLAFPAGMRAHRALADVLMTCELWKHIYGLVRARLDGRAPDIGVMQSIAKKPKGAVEAYLAGLTTA